MLNDKPVIDISKYQTPLKIDYSKVSEQVAGIIANCMMSDDVLDHIMAQCNAYKIPLGFYANHSSGDAPAATQVSQLSRIGLKWERQAKPGSILYNWVALDDVIAAANLLSIWAEYQNNYKALTKLGIYCGLYNYETYIAINRITRVITDNNPLWLAYYNNDRKKGVHDIVMRQWTDKGSIDGISGMVDLNEVYGRIKPLVSDSIRDLERKQHLDLALEVVRGSYGAGNERKVRLGDKYDTVQNIVNECYHYADRAILGYFGNGDYRRKVLGDVYDIVQEIVNQKMADK